MAPLPLAGSISEGKGHRLLSSLSTLFKPNPSTPRPQSLKGKKSKPEVSLPGYPPLPLGTEKETWLQNLDLPDLGECDELILNPWNDYRKRSLQDQERSAMAPNAPHTGSPVQQKPEGEYRLTLSQEIMFIIFAFLVTTLVWGTVAWAVAKMKRRLDFDRERCEKRPGEDQGSRKASVVGYSPTLIGLWFITLCSMVYLLRVFTTIRGA